MRIHLGPRPLRAASVIGLLLVTLATGDALARTTPAGYEYVSPRPGAQYVSPLNNVILRTGQKLNRGLLQQVQVDVVGETSGAHGGSLQLSDDDATVLFQPDRPFALRERVHVTVQPRGRGRAFDVLPPLQFDFEVSAVDPSAGGAAARRASARDLERDLAPQLRSSAAGAGLPRLGPLDEDPDPDPGPGPDPDDTPKVVASVNRTATDGHLYVAAFRSLQEPGFLCVLDELHTPVFTRKLPGVAIDFKSQPDGRITYWTDVTTPAGPPGFVMLDARGEVVDHIETGNGYETDFHELQVLPNGHSVLMSYDSQRVRMDLVVPGGRPDASVIGLVVQELDRRHRVVFQWRSWDDFAITDMVDPTISLRGAAIDYVHGNSIAIGPDGNFVISSRHLNEVTKVSRRTGEVIWRFGPRAVNNQFAITGDARGFSHQHDARVLDNGNLTVFDNGNYVLPQLSRGVEYEMDEQAKTARLVWEYRHTPPLYGGFIGNVQRLDDGGSVICWGGATRDTKFTELAPDGRVLYEGGFQPNDYNTYRALKGRWRTTRILTDVDRIDFGGVAAGAPVTRTVTVTNPGPAPFLVNAVSTTGAAFAVAAIAPATLAAGATLTLAVTFTAPASGEAHGKLYVGTRDNGDLLLQEVALDGTSGEPAALRRGPAARIDASVTADRTRPEATIRYSLPRESQVEVAVFDVRGRRVATLADGRVAAGEHSAAWDSRRSPSGVYFCRVMSDEGSITRKFAVVH